VPTFPRVTLSQPISDVENRLSSSGFRRLFGALSQLALFQFPFPRGRDRFETASYAIPVVPALLARNAEEAATAARPFLAAGNSVAVKILSPDIVHKSDISGIALGLTSEAAVGAATEDIIARARAAEPEARRYARLREDPYVIPLSAAIVE
jgi:ATP-grasp domain